MTWYRLLIPSWDFFAQPGHRARVEVNFDDSSLWQPLWPLVTVRWFRLFFNPEGNVHHWANRVSEELLLECMSLSESQEVSSLKTFQLIEAEVSDLAHHRGASRFAFRLVSVAPDFSEQIIFTTPQKKRAQKT